jgi:hypothetical protein
MTTEERFQRIEENLLVQSRLQANTDRALAAFRDHVNEWVKHTEAWNERLQAWGEKTQAWGEKTQAWGEKTQAWIEEAEVRIAQLEAMSKAILERWDRFLQGRGGDGHKTK